MRELERRSDAQEAPARPPAERQVETALVLSFLALAAAAHGLQVADLGLYWDEILQFLQGHHSARGDLWRFVASDTAGSLVSERPLSYFAWAPARLAYAASVAAMKAYLVLLMAVGATLVARLMRSLDPDPRVRLAAGALFLTLPLAPLQPAWGATVHHQVALLLALAAMLSSERSVGRGGRWPSFLPAAGLYLLSLLTQELYFLLPVAWMAGRALWPARGALRAPALRGAGAFAIVLGIHALFRKLVVPLYGTQVYELPAQLDLAVLVRRTLAALRFGLWPWDQVADQLAAVERSPRPFVGAALAGAVLVAALVTAKRWAPTREATAGADPRRGESLRAVALAASVFLAAVATRGAVPLDTNKILGISARFNFVTLPAAALLFAALFGAALSARPARARAVRAVFSSLLATTLVAAVAAGAVGHGLVKEQLARDWWRLLAVFDRLREVAPTLAPGTIAVVAGDAFQRIAQHEETSSLFMALYDDESLMANDLKRLRVVAGQGVMSTTYGHRAHWFSPRPHPVVLVDGTELVENLDPDRLVLFRNRGDTIAAVPTMSLGRAREKVYLLHRPERVLATPPKTSAAWRHLDSTRPEGGEGSRP